MKKFRGIRWEYTSMKDCNGFAIVKIRDKATNETWYEVQSKKFSTLKEAKEWARAYEDREKARIKEAKRVWAKERYLFQSILKDRADSSAL